MKLCPVCRLFLDEREWRGHATMVCTSCGGTWMRREAYDAALARDRSRLIELTTMIPGAASAAALEGLSQLCPDCQTAALQPVEDAPEGLRVTMCSRCGGRWLSGQAAPRTVEAPPQPDKVAEAAPPVTHVGEVPTLPVAVEEPPSPFLKPEPAEDRMADGAVDPYVQTPAIELPEPPIRDAEDAWSRLVEGNARFASGQARRPRGTTARADEVLFGQHPFAVVVGCSDSRVPPEIILDQRIGDIFVVRTAGQVVTASTMASILYAVDHLAVPLVVVLGHTDCGAVKGTLTQAAGPDPYLEPIVRAIQPAVSLAAPMAGDQVTNTVRIHASRTAEYIRRVIAERVPERERVTVVAAVYHLDTRLIARREDISPTPDRPEVPQPPEATVSVRTEPHLEAERPQEAELQPPGEASQSRFPCWCPKCRTGYDKHVQMCSRCGVLLVQPWYRVPCLKCKKDNLIGLERCWNCRAELHPDWLAAGQRPPKPPRVAVRIPLQQSNTDAAGCSQSVIAMVAVALALAVLLLL